MASLAFVKLYKNSLKIKKKVLFYKTYFEECNINRIPPICSHYMIITKFCPKKWVCLVLEKVYENCLKIKGKCYINQKPLIWSHDKIKMKFGPKKWVSFVLDKVYKNSPKIKEKYYFTKPTSK